MSKKRKTDGSEPLVANPVVDHDGDQDDENNVRAEAHEAERDAALASKKAKVFEQHVKLVMDGVLPLKESDSKYFKEFIWSLDPNITIPGSKVIAKIINKHKKEQKSIHELVLEYC